VGVARIVGLARAGIACRFTLRLNCHHRNHGLRRRSPGPLDDRP
jgi:hypothetical protein